MDNGICERKIKCCSKVTVMSTSLDCRYLATGDSLGNVCLWKIMTGKLIIEFKGTHEMANSLAIYEEKYAIFGDKKKICIINMANCVV
jgi:WD40 repeat protein